MDDEYRDRGLAILGFPSNQFGSQEPGTAADIQKFIDGYGVKFYMNEKIEVNGPRTHELYKFLRCNSQLFDAKTKKCKEIPWNFAKFLVNTRTSQVSYYEPRVDPFSLKAEIERQLEQTKA